MALRGLLRRYLVRLLVGFSCMPELLKETIKELQEIIRKEYGRSLSFAEVSEIAYGLVGYFDLLAKINSKKEKIYGE